MGALRKRDAPKNTRSSEGVSRTSEEVKAGVRRQRSRLASVGMDILKEHIELPIRQISANDRIQFYSRGKGKIGTLLAGRVDVCGMTGYGG